MKIALGFEENSYSSQQARRFGRAPYFITINTGEQDKIGNN